MLIKSTLPCRTESVSNMSLSSSAVVHSSSGCRLWDSNVNNVLSWKFLCSCCPLKLFSRTRIVCRATHRAEELSCSSSVVFWLSQIANIWLGLQPNSVETHSCFEQKLSSVQFSSAAQSCPTLCDPMNRSTPGLPVHLQLLKFTQTHVHRVGNAIQTSHAVSSPSPPAPNPSQHQSLFQKVNSSHEVAKVLEFQLQHQSFQWTHRTDLL